MADRGRDLKFSILSDVDKFDTERPARGLEDLADAATAAGKKVDGLDDSQRRQVDSLRDMIDEAKRAKSGVDEYGDQTKATARKVDDAFDAIAKSSKAASRKVEDSTDHMGDSVRDVRDEANDTAREMGASFDGSLDSVQDGFQELAANAGQAFGPLGLAAGAAAAVGVGLIRAQAEKLKEQVDELVSDMLESGGRLSEAFIDNKLQDMARDGSLVKLEEQAANLNISFEDLARAKAGDAAASERVLSRVADLSDALSRQAAKSKSASGETYAMQVALNALAGDLATTVRANHLAERATAAYGRAVTTAGNAGVNAAHVTGAAWDDLRASLGRPITPKLDLDDSAFYRKLSAAQRARARVMADFDRTGDYRSRP